jgi:type I restriction enzyme, S subunit
MHKTKNTESLKPGWRRVKFGDVVQLSKARCADPLAEGVERFVGLEHLEPGDLRIRNWGNVADGVTFTSVFQPGQVLFGKRRAYQRKVAVADFSGVCSGDIYVMETKDAQVLMPGLLPFICQTDAFFEHAVGTSAGSLSPRTNWTSLADFEFPLPPIELQARLLAALNAFERTLVAHQSLLSATNVGIQALLANWWEEKSDVLRPLAELSLISGAYGINAPAKTFEQGKPRYIRITDIDIDGRLQSADAVGVDSQDYGGYLLAGNDLLIARTGNTVGKSFLYSENLGPAVYAGYLVKFRLDTNLALPKYIFLMTRAPQYRDWIKSTVRVGAQPNINAKEYSSLKLPAPSLEHQQFLVEKLEYLEVSRENCTKRIEKLRSVKAMFFQRKVMDVI